MSAIDRTGLPVAASRPDRATPRDGTPTPNGAREAAARFAALLDRALAPSSAARPLTRATAADDSGAARAGDDVEAGDAATVATPEVDASPAEASAAGASTTARAAESVESSETDAVEDAASADEARAAAGTAAADVPAAGVHRGVELLAPELRERLQRVVERMQAEHGHDVRVVETYRSQSRQDQLHAQGRTTDGPVVTWTRRSNHTLGRAVDVTVNGTYDDPQAYATLQKVAREEGLHVLGPRDPGHLELPADVPGTSSIAGRRVDLASLAEIARPAGAAVRVSEVHVGHEGPATAASRMAPMAAVAQVAAVARVASVAATAGVARVATPAAVAAPGAARNAGATTAAGRPTRVGATPPEAAAAEPSSRAKRGEESAEATPVVVEAAAPTLGGGQGGGGERAPQGGLVARAEAPASAVPTDSIARLDRIEALRDGAAARPLSHVTLRLENATGGEDRIRVGLNGLAVGATMDIGDAAAAERVSSAIGELQRALESRGLEADALRVRRMAAAAPESIEMHRVAGIALEREAARSGNTSTGQQQQEQSAPRERPDGRPTPDEPRQDSSNPRHRSRRDQKEGR